MQMDEGLDTGDILYARKVDITKEDTGESLFNKLEDISKQLIVEALDRIEAGDINPIRQDGFKATYARILKKEMGELDFTKDAAELERLIRAFTPWPGTYTHLKGKILKVIEASTACMDELERECKDPALQESPGRIAGISGNAVYVATGRDFLKLTWVQLEGKKKMKVSDFLRGCPVNAGDKLG